MKYRITGIALAALLLVPLTGGLRARAADDEARITLSIPNTECAQCVSKLTETLKGTKGVSNVAGFTPAGKRAVVTYMPAQVSVQQIAQAVSDTPGLHGKPYQASLLIRVTDLRESATQEKAQQALKSVPGVASASVADQQAELLAIQFAPLADADKAGGAKGASQAQIVKALTDAGLTVTVEIAPATAALR
jgi:copper chaperone CopZ